MFLLQPKGGMARAISSCSEIAKPKENHAKYLSSLFPGYCLNMPNDYFVGLFVIVAFLFVLFYCFDLV